MSLKDVWFWRFSCEQTGRGLWWAALVFLPTLRWDCVTHPDQTRWWPSQTSWFCAELIGPRPEPEEDKHSQDRNLGSRCADDSSCFCWNCTDTHHDPRSTKGPKHPQNLLRKPLDWLLNLYFDLFMAPWNLLKNRRRILKSFRGSWKSRWSIKPPHRPINFWRTSVIPSIILKLFQDLGLTIITSSGAHRIS